MDKRYLIDTNIIIYYLDNKIPANQIEFIESVFKTSFNISTITKIELMGWHKINDDIKSLIKSFLSNSKIFYIDSEVEDSSIRIKQSHKIQIPDAIIAATSLLNGLTLITRNTKDFDSIKKLKIYNPFL
jgi:predicted nucleic acid-binding protein